MPRNLYNRVELLSPVSDEALQEQLGDVLDRAFADNTNAWELGSDGRWNRLSPGGDPPRNLQDEMMELHAQRSKARPAPAA
jgi:polyphosphate kinase